MLKKKGNTFNNILFRLFNYKENGKVAGAKLFLKKIK